MGKSKGIRAKGNAKPSSSSHSAQLLNFSGKPTLGFLGFSGLANSSQSEDAAEPVHSSFAVVMKKMLKRDTTTKLKALQEFKDLCDQNDKDDVSSIVPFWPRLFNRLALDYDRRVREAALQANGQLISKIKKRMAPHLRSVMGVWLLCHCDSHSPAAAIAQSTFAMAFPQEKHSEALMFCKEEIISFLKENLFEQTAQSLSEPNSDSQEVQDKYIFLLSCTLNALGYFLEKVSENDRQVLLEAFKEFVSENKFWKFAKYNNSQVQSSWYNLISILCRILPNIFENFERKLGCIILGNINVKDDLVAPSIWEAVLHYVVNFKNYWEIIDIKKVVLPPLWSVLKGGGTGNPVVYSPYLLPLLSTFPATIIFDENFLDSFFSSIRKSIMDDKLKKSASECNAAVAASMECFEYIVCHSMSVDHKNLLEYLIINQLLPLIESSFDNRNAHLPVSKLYPMLGSFLQKLEKYVIDKSNSAKLDVYKYVLECFWENAMVICTSTLSSDCQLQDTNLAFLAYFFYSLHEVMYSSNKNAKLVSFASAQEEKDQNISSNSSSADSSSSYELLYLFKYTVQFASVICGKIQESFNSNQVKLLCEIIKTAYCSEFFNELLKLQNETVSHINEAPVVFFQKNILLWLSNASDNKSICDCIINVIFAICSCLMDEASLSILNEFCKIEHVKFLKNLVEQGLSQHAGDKLFFKWLSSLPFGQNFISIIQKIITVEDINDETKLLEFSAYMDAVFIFLMHTNADGTKLPLMENSYAVNTLNLFNKSLLYFLDHNEWNSQNCKILNFICDVTDIILECYKECVSSSVVSSLLRTILKLILSTNTNLPVECEQNLSSLWKSSVRQFAKEIKNSNSDDFFHETSLVLKNMLITCKEDKLACLLMDYILFLLNLLNGCCSVEEENLHANNILFDVFQEIFPSEIDWNTLKVGQHLNMLPAYIERKLFYPIPDESTVIDPMADIPQHVHLAKLISNIISNYITFSELNNFLIIKSIIRQLPHLLWSFSYCESNGYLRKENMKQYSCASVLQKNCFKILASLPKNEVLALLRKFLSLCTFHGFRWALTLRNICEISKSLYPEISSYYFELMSSCLENCTDNNCVAVQVLIHHIHQDEKTRFLKSHIEKFLSFPDEQGGFRVLAEICCCLQECDIDQSSDIQTYVSDFLCRMLKKKSYYLKKEADEVFMYNIITEAILCAVVKKFPSIFSLVEMNFAFEILLASLIVCENVEDYTNASLLLLLHHTCSLLYITYSTVFDEVKANQEMNVFPKELWKEKLVENLCKQLLPYFLNLAETQNKVKILPSVIESVLAVIAQALDFIPAENLSNYVYGADSDESLVSLQSVSFERCLSLLLHDIRPVQIGIHSLLLKIVPTLLRARDTDKIEAENDICVTRLQPLINILEHTNLVVESMLIGVEFGESCFVVPFTDSYTYTMAYLLSWSELFELIASCSPQDRSNYIVYLEEKHLLFSLLSNLFHIMPENPVSCFQKYNASTVASTKEILKINFTNLPVLTLLGTPKENEIQCIACNLFYCALKRIPALVRSWWNNLDRKAAEIVNRYVTNYVSTLLSTEEIQTVQDSIMEFNNMTVRARLSSREVIATYTLDDNFIELSIQLPVNYPLGAVIAERRGKVGVTTPQWRHWLMQLTTFLTYQNGSILDAIILWKKNLDKKFEGIEECMICYYIIHNSSAKLPKLSCRTCKKKFHSDCLYKWFKTSNNSTCPLCRNYF